MTYAGIAGAGITAPLIAAGLPEVPVMTGLAGMAIGELVIQPVLFVGNIVASGSKCSPPWLQKQNPATQELRN